MILYNIFFSFWNSISCIYLCIQSANIYPPKNICCHTFKMTLDIIYSFDFVCICLCVYDHISSLIKYHLNIKTTLLCQKELVSLKPFLPCWASTLWIFFFFFIIVICFLLLFFFHFKLKTIGRYSSFQSVTLKYKYRVIWNGWQYDIQIIKINTIYWYTYIKYKYIYTVRCNHKL